MKAMISGSMIGKYQEEEEKEGKEESAEEEEKEEKRKRRNTDKVRPKTREILVQLPTSHNGLCAKHY